MGYRLILSQSFVKICLNFGARLFRSPMCVLRVRSFLIECACAGEFAQFALLFGLLAVRPSPVLEAGSPTPQRRDSSCGVGAHALRTHSVRALSLCRAARSCPVDSATVPEASQRPSAPSTPSSSFVPHALSIPTSTPWELVPQRKRGLSLPTRTAHRWEWRTLPSTARPRLRRASAAARSRLSRRHGRRSPRRWGSDTSTTRWRRRQSSSMNSPTTCH